MRNDRIKYILFFILISSTKTHADYVSQIFQGPMTLGCYTIALDCTVSLSTYIDESTGEFLVAGGYASGPLCNSVQFTGLPWPGDLNYTSGELSLDNVGFVTPLGPCGPEDINIDFSGGPVPTVIDFGNVTFVGAGYLQGQLIAQ